MAEDAAKKGANVTYLFGDKAEGGRPRPQLVKSPEQVFAQMCDNVRKRFDKPGSYEQSALVAAAEFVAAEAADLLGATVGDEGDAFTALRKARDFFESRDVDFMALLDGGLAARVSGGGFEADGKRYALMSMPLSGDAMEAEQKKPGFLTFQFYDSAHGQWGGRPRFGAAPAYAEIPPARAVYDAKVT